MPIPCSARLGTAVSAATGVTMEGGRSLAVAVATALYVLAGAGGCGSPLAGGASLACGGASCQLPDTWSQGPVRQSRFVLISAMSGAVTLN